MFGLFKSREKSGKIDKTIIGATTIEQYEANKKLESNAIEYLKTLTHEKLVDELTKYPRVRGDSVWFVIGITITYKDKVGE